MSTVQNPSEFLEDLINQIRGASKSIHIQSMNFETGVVVDKLVAELLLASKREISIHLTFDWVSEKYIHGDLPLLPQLDQKKIKEAQEIRTKTNVLLERLKQAGVHITITNKPSSFGRLLLPVGRNHKKMYIIDEKIAWIGGLNLFDEAFKNVDFMVKFTEKGVVLALGKEFQKVNSLKEKDDYQVVCTEETKLLVDTGTKNKSIIYDAALKASASCEDSLIFVSQFVPEGKLLKNLIKAAVNNKKVIVITSFDNDKLFSDYPYRFTYLYFLTKIRKHKNIQLVHLSQRVHAKLLIVDHKLALFGSHNLVATGVIFGTEEIAIVTYDTSLVKQLTDFYKKALTYI
jgi:phosphatidylserine/phosphatidylglycerophosphate/cardiolipin synthase-like enzyme